MKCCDITAGKFIHKIEILSAERIPGSRGGYKKDLSVLDEVRCWIRPMSSYTRSQLGDFDRTKQQVTIVFRYRDDLAGENYYKFKGKIYRQLGAPRNLEYKNKYLEVNAEEVEL